jgi:excisionase family DNA binding protein
MRVLERLRMRCSAPFGPSSGGVVSRIPAEQESERPTANLGPVLEQILAELRDVRALLEGAHKPLLTVEEVARAVGRSPFTIRRWIKDDQLKATRVAGTGPRGRLLIAREQLDNLIALGLGAEIPAAACTATGNTVGEAQIPNFGGQGGRQ